MRCSTFQPFVFAAVCCPRHCGSSFLASARIVTQPLAPDPSCEQMFAVVGYGCWDTIDLSSGLPQSPQTTTTHPTSRCQQAWGGCWLSPAVLRHPLPSTVWWFVAGSVHYRRRSTHVPPHQQWLRGLGQVVRRLVSWLSSVSGWFSIRGGGGACRCSQL